MLESTADQRLAYVALWLIIGFIAMTIVFRHRIAPILAAPLITFNIIDGDTGYPARHRQREEVMPA